MRPKTLLTAKTLPYFREKYAFVNVLFFCASREFCNFDSRDPIGHVTDMVLVPKKRVCRNLKQHNLGMAYNMMWCTKKAENMLWETHARGRHIYANKTRLKARGKLTCKPSIALLQVLAMFDLLGGGEEVK